LPILDRARQLAEDVLLPAATHVDRAELVPPKQLNLLAAEGFYGLPGPPEVGGLGVADVPAAARIVEVLAGGCLATTFVWLQHLGAVLAAAYSPLPGLREEWLERLCRGTARAGVALAALRPGPAAVTARPVDGGYTFSGTAAWVTGWGMIDVLHTAARTPDDTVVWALLDAVEAATLAVEPLELVAVNASRTVQVRFADHFVPEARVLSRSPYQGGPSTDAASLRMNGALALGVAGRCAALLPAGELADGVRGRVDELRKAMDAALSGGGAPDMTDLRAAASEFAMQAAGLLTVATGARAVLRDEHAQRLVREATFLLVFGSRPAIKTALLDRLTRAALPG
jgi:alkylation response protein AidB-like acyl-CoA dehydrogenase